MQENHTISLKVSHREIKTVTSATHGSIFSLKIKVNYNDEV